MKNQSRTFEYILVNRTTHRYTYDHRNIAPGWERIRYSADAIRGLIYEPFPSGMEADAVDLENNEI